MLAVKPATLRKPTDISTLAFVSISAITSRPLKTPVLSVTREHICSVGPSAEFFTILTSGISDIDILTRKALLVRELRPSLNGKVG